MLISEKLKRLREQMRQNGISAYIVPSNDPHINEYLPEYWKSRQWISGFTGSSGTFAITKKRAALWTDSRYFLQAEQELAGSEIELCRIGVEGTLSIENWIANQLNKNDIVGFDGNTFTVTNANNLIRSLKKEGIIFNSSVDLIKPIWKKRPKLPKSKVFGLELRYTGLSVSGKLEQIRNLLKSKNANSYLLCALDEICWTFNIRGNDIKYNPVVLSYGIIDNHKATLFIDFEKVDESLVNYLHEQGVEIKPYKKIENYLGKLKKGKTIYIDPARINYHLYSIIPSKVEITEGLGIVTEMKSRKNPIELEGFRQSMVQDGLAMVEFWYWLEQNMGKAKITETIVCEKLKEFRSTKKGFVSEGFATITGYRDHGAIVHYLPTKENEYEINPEGFLLFDSGGQYLTGTTDTTRTIHLSEPTDEEMEDFTLVLKGMIQLSMIKFPVGTRGSQLDTLARMAMWKNNINYGHGTGHGVGSFLNVHEGPMQIRPDNYLPIEAGVVMSNEPGIYRVGKYGVRIENMIACIPDVENEFGKFLRFETLTLCPIDLKPVKVKMLSSEEREWLNSYHKMVYKKISPYLKGDIKNWLKEKTKNI